MVSTVLNSLQVGSAAELSTGFQPPRLLIPLIMAMTYNRCHVQWHRASPDVLVGRQRTGHLIHTLWPSLQNTGPL